MGANIFGVHLLQSRVSNVIIYEKYTIEVVSEYICVSSWVVCMGFMAMSMALNSSRRTYW